MLCVVGLNHTKLQEGSYIIIQQLLYMEFVDRAVHGSGLCPTQTQPKWLQWVKIWPEIDPDNLVKFLGSSLVGFRLHRVCLGFYHRGRNLARSDEIWPKSGRIRRDLAGSVEISSNLEGSVRISVLKSYCMMLCMILCVTLCITWCMT